MKTILHSATSKHSTNTNHLTRVKTPFGFYLCLAAISAVCVSSASAQTPGNAVVNNLTVNGTATGVVPTVGNHYLIVELTGANNEVARGQKLLAAYAKAKTMGASADSRVVVLIPPGNYAFLPGSGIIMDTAYVDLVGMFPAQMTKRTTVSIVSGSSTYVYEKTVPNWNPSLNPPEQNPPEQTSGVVIGGYGNVIEQRVDHVRIANLILNHIHFGGDYTPGENDYDTAAYWPTGSYTNTVIEHVLFRTYGTFESWALRSQDGWLGDSVSYPGTYRDCGVDGGCYAFFAPTGRFEDCVAGIGGFQSYNGFPTTGQFLFCTGGDYSFESYNSSTTTGYFKNCFAGINSFTGCNGATFENCAGLENSFTSAGSVFAGRFKNCIASCSNPTSDVVNGFNVWGGYFEDCKSGKNSFRWNSASSASTVLVHCRAGAGSFGPFNIASTDFSTPKGDLLMGTFTAGDSQP
jgi:hypothetical protein